MNKITAYQMARKVFPELRPRAASSFNGTGYGKEGAVLVPVFGTDDVLVLYHETDLFRMMNACQMELKRRGKISRIAL